MAAENTDSNHGEEVIGWDAPEYEKHTRTRTWYIGATIIALLLLLFSFITIN
jgi:hypothetical protein